MAVLALKTELDVAQLLLAEGWIPEEINGILAFPLPRAAFHQLGNKSEATHKSDVVKATLATPTTLYRARQLLLSAGWLDRELESLLKPYLYSQAPWSNQASRQVRGKPPAGWWSSPTLSLRHYRRTMALKRVVSLSGVITAVSIAVAVLG